MRKQRFKTLFKKKKTKNQKMHHFNIELNVLFHGGSQEEYSECSFKTESIYEIYT